ncbi:MAG: hypothetical protein KDD06_06670, partial [Phaeodactylibacter sp.]|nr:hypothetical protein [Phaeodactylibacter sp.]
IAGVMPVSIELMPIIAMQPASTTKPQIASGVLNDLLHLVFFQPTREHESLEFGGRRAYIS